MGIALAEKIGLSFDVINDAKHYFKNLTLNKEKFNNNNNKIIDSEVKNILLKVNIDELTLRRAFEIIEHLKNLINYDTLN